MRHAKDNLSREHIKRCRYGYWPLKLVGFVRFDIVNNKIVKLSSNSVIYNSLIIIATNIAVVFIMYTAAIKEQFLIFHEILTLLYFNALATLIIINITFYNRSSGSDILQYCIEIDAFLGETNTKFMRDIAMRIYLTLCSIIAPIQSAVVVYMYFVFTVPMSIHVVGSTFFIWVFFIYYDYCFMLYNHIFITIRARYLNVAIMKIARFDPKKLPRKVFFNELIWRDKFDDLVDFHRKAGIEEFNKAFRMVFSQLRRLESSYRFLIILGVATNVMGAFATVQTFIIYMKTPVVDVVRAGAITGWLVSSWGFILILSQQMDMFYQQIDQTKLICTYTQLKPSNSEHVIKLTKSILRTLEFRESRIAVYDLFVFDTGLVLRLVASIFVYITVQLQLAFPNIEENHRAPNNTVW